MEELPMPDTETEDSDFEITMKSKTVKQKKPTTVRPPIVMSSVTLTFSIYGSPQITIGYRNVYERCFACHIINSLNSEIYRIKTLKGYADHLETVVRNLEVDRLRKIIMRCTKIFSVEIDEYETANKNKEISHKIAPIEVAECLLLICQTRITRDNISDRHTNTLERLVEQHRSRLTFFIKNNYCLRYLVAPASQYSSVSPVRYSE